jgi:hypothetical protein
MHGELTHSFIDAGDLPDGFAWPLEPAVILA